MCKKCSNKKQRATKEEFYPFTNRPLIRPHISFGRAILRIVITMLAIGLVVWFFLWVFSNFQWYSEIPLAYHTQFILLYLLIGLITIVISLKRIIFFFIKIYQRYVPYDIRCNCLFVPNCSEYMILAIEKYGVKKGVKKGFNRLLRCHEPNGGEDYP